MFTSCQNKKSTDFLGLVCVPKRDRLLLWHLKNLTHPLCIASLYYCYYPGTLDVHSLYGHRYTCSGKHVVMEVDPDASDVDQLSEVNVRGDEEVQGQKNAHGSLIGANSREIRRETAIVTESGLPGTSQNINRVVRISPSQIWVLKSRSSRIFFSLIDSNWVKYAILPVCRFAVLRIPAVEGKVRDTKVVRAWISLPEYLNICMYCSSICSDAKVLMEQHISANSLLVIPWTQRASFCSIQRL